MGTTVDGSYGRVVFRILLVCTANRCRSPLGAALLARAADAAGVPVAVDSRGTHAVIGGAVTAKVRAVAPDFPALDQHRARQLAAADLLAADLVLTMERRQVLVAETLLRGSAGRTFAWRDLAALGDRVPPGGLPSTAWVAALHQARGSAAVAAASPCDDVADPTGRRRAHHRQLRDELERLATTTVVLLQQAMAPPAGDAALAS